MAASDKVDIDALQKLKVADLGYKRCCGPYPDGFLMSVDSFEIQAALPFKYQLAIFALMVRMPKRSTRTIFAVDGQVCKSRAAAETKS